jgi:hypothetical protein
MQFKEENHALKDHVRKLQRQRIKYIDGLQNLEEFKQYIKKLYFKNNALRAEHDLEKKENKALKQKLENQVVIIEKLKIQLAEATEDNENEETIARAVQIIENLQAESRKNANQIANLKAQLVESQQDVRNMKQKIAVEEKNNNRAFRTIKHLRAQLETSLQQNKIPTEIVQLIKNLQAELSESQEVQNTNTDEAVLMIKNLKKQLAESTNEKQKFKKQDPADDEHAKKNENSDQLIQTLVDKNHKISEEEQYNTHAFGRIKDLPAEILQQNTNPAKFLQLIKNLQVQLAESQKEVANEKMQKETNASNAQTIIKILQTQVTEAHRQISRQKESSDENSQSQFAEVQKQIDQQPHENAKQAANVIQNLKKQLVQSRKDLVNMEQKIKKYNKATQTKLKNSQETTVNKKQEIEMLSQKTNEEAAEMIESLQTQLEKTQNLQNVNANDLEEQKQILDEIEKK